MAWARRLQRGLADVLVLPELLGSILWLGMVPKELLLAVLGRGAYRYRSSGCERNALTSGFCSPPKKTEYGELHTPVIFMIDRAREMLARV